MHVYTCWSNNDVELMKYGASVIKLYCGTCIQRGLSRHT